MTAPYRALQEFMIGQMNAGMLLCLCSKNNEKDALDVFDQRTDMPLKREHLVSWRINWNSKSENIRSLAKSSISGWTVSSLSMTTRLNARMSEINCPAVLTLQLPRERRIVPFIPESHLGVRPHEFDRGRSRPDQDVSGKRARGIGTASNRSP